MNESMLQMTFIPFGDIKEVFIPRDTTVEGTHRGFGFVEFEREEDARAAVDNMHLSEVFGQILRCNLARPTRITTSGVHNAPIWELEASNSAVIENDEESESVE
jgi:peptidyl-prolyl isomerase E (cyclophilin E)